MNVHKKAVECVCIGRSPSSGQPITAPREGGENGEMGWGGGRELEAERNRKKGIMHENKLEVASYPEGVDLHPRLSVGSEVRAQLWSQ